MAFAREIFVQIKNKIPFKQSEKEKDSHYAYVGNSIVRISNHCTWLYIWDEILEQNPKDKGKPIISLVFEDEGSTFDERCLLLKRFRRNPIKVQEFVFPIHGNGQYISSEDIKYIIESLFAVQQGEIYKDRTGKCEFFQRISKSPEDGGSTTQQQPTNENKQNTKINKNMKKQTIKLNESQLRNIIQESVKKVLNEEINPFYDTEIATKTHKLGATQRLNSIIASFNDQLKEWINDEKYQDSIDKYFLINVDAAIRKVIESYGLPK